MSNICEGYETAKKRAVMCLSNGSHWLATTAEYQKKRSDYWFFFYRAFFVGTRLECFIDSDLSMETHVKRTVSCCFSTLGHLRNIRRQIPTAVFQSLVIVLVVGRMDCCNSVFSLFKVLQHGWSLESAVQNTLRNLRSNTDALARLQWFRVPAHPVQSRGT